MALAEIQSGERIAERVPSNKLTNPSKTRQRKLHHKTRTGCLTCKRRRKKCDEAKPVCLRCVKGSFKCEGYEPAQCQVDLSFDDTIDYHVRNNFSQIPYPGTLPDGFNTELIDESLRPLSVDLDLLSSQSPALALTSDPAQVSRITESHNHETEVEDSVISNLAGQGNAVHTGYGALRPVNTYSNTVRSSTFLDFLKSPYIRPDLFAPTDIEAHCFTFFQSKTLPLLASYFEASVWRGDMARCALSASHPALFLVASALGAVHRRYTLGITPEALEYCGHSMTLYRKARRAIEDVKKALPDPETSTPLPRHEIVMASEILLGVFQTFQDEEAKSRAHLQTALACVLSKKHKAIHTERWRCMTKSRPRIVCSFIHTLCCKAIEILGSPISVPFSNELNLVLPDIPDEFTSVEQMRDLLFTEVDNVSHAMGRLLTNVNERKAYKLMHERRLAKWSTAYMRMIETHEDTARFRKLCNLLHVVRSTCYIMTWVSLFIEGRGATVPKIPVLDHDQTPFTSWDEDHELVHAANAAFDAVQMLSKYGWDMLTGTKGFMESVLMNHPGFRLDDKDETYFGNDVSVTIPGTVPSGKYGMSPIGQLLGVFAVAERVSTIEEQMIVETVLRSLPPEADPDCCDIACPATAVDGTRTVLVRYYLPHPDGGSWWIQDWWQFAGGMHVTAGGF